MIAFVRRYRFYRYVILGLIALSLIVALCSRWGVMAQDNPNVELVRTSVYQHLFDSMTQQGDQQQASLLSIDPTVLFSASGHSALAVWFVGESGGFSIAGYDDPSNAWIFKCSWGGGLADAALVAKDCDVPVAEVSSLFEAERQREAAAAVDTGTPLDYQ